MSTRNSQLMCLRSFWWAQSLSQWGISSHLWRKVGMRRRSFGNQWIWSSSRIRDTSTQQRGPKWWRVLCAFCGFNWSLVQSCRSACFGQFVRGGSILSLCGLPHHDWVRGSPDSPKWVCNQSAQAALRWLGMDILSFSAISWVQAYGWVPWVFKWFFQQFPLCIERCFTTNTSKDVAWFIPKFLPVAVSICVCQILLLQEYVRSSSSDGWMGSLFHIASSLHIEMNKKHWKNQGKPTEL